MPYTGTTSDTTCFASIAGLNCGPIISTVSLVATSVALNVGILLFDTFVIFYRWQHGLFNYSYQRVNGYLVPRPIDSLLTSIIIIKLLEVVSNLLNLINWQSTLDVSWLAHLLAQALHATAIVHFIAGIIVYVPSSFTRNSPRNNRLSQRRTTLNSEMEIRNLNVTQQRSYNIYVPSISVLFYFLVFFTLFILGSTVSIGAWIFSVQYSVQSAKLALIERDLTIMASMIYFVIILLSTYYCFSFYKITRICRTNSSSSRPSMNNDEKNLARDYRQIFLSILVTFALFTLFMITTLVLEKYFARIGWLHVFIVFIEEMIMYTMVHFSVLYIALRNSKNNIQSLNALTAHFPIDKAVEMPPTGRESFSHSVRNSQGSFSTFHQTLDSTATWQELFTMNEQRNNTCIIQTTDNINNNNNNKSIMTNYDCVVYNPSSNTIPHYTPRL
ncbi:hypothetical protein BDF22DRAFT_25951 [Syncephalis plumigaleata]|nr:hypothetical protein BDF22DRAFT_25951 [Syncephalis plumigaleata]